MDETTPRGAGVTEILNYVKAWDSAAISELPICVRLACELQSQLVAGTPSEDYQTGSIRDTQVLIGPYQGCSIQESTYVPPPPGDSLTSGLAAWEKWLHEPDVDEIVKVALGHYQFEALHPFTDGNGRIGRLLAILQLVRAGLLPGPLINLSPYLEHRSDEYRHRLRNVSTEGAMDEWIQFFCQALSSQAKEAQSRIRSLLAWRDHTVEELRSNRRKGAIVSLIPFLIQYPMITVKQAQSLLGVSNPSANKAINELTKMAVLTETTGNSYGRVFEATKVLDIVFAP